MFRTTRFFYPHGIEGEAMDNTSKEFNNLDKAINHAKRYATGLRFAGVQVEDEKGDIIYEITSDMEAIDNRKEVEEETEMENKNFEGNDFVVQVIAKGEFVDNAGGGCSFLVEATTIRLNHIALNAWIMSNTMNCRECYDTNEEWEAYEAEIAERRKAWTAQIVEALGIDSTKGSVSITQSQSEVFTVVHIRKIA